MTLLGTSLPFGWLASGIIRKMALFEKSELVEIWLYIYIYKLTQSYDLHDTLRINIFLARCSKWSSTPKYQPRQMGAAARTIEFSDWSSNSPFEVFDKIKSDFLFDELLFSQHQKTWRKQYQLLHQQLFSLHNTKVSRYNLPSRSRWKSR